MPRIMAVATEQLDVFEHLPPDGSIVLVMDV
jgi:hypothetical protein